jgi:hypothetical protein
VPETKELALLRAVLSDLGAWFETEGASWVVIGGVAASLLGRPCPTRNIDALVSMAARRWPRFLEAGEKRGFVPRGANVFDSARETNVLQMRHQKSGLDVNIVFGSLPFEKETVAGATWVDPEGIMIPLPRPEDLIVMKAVAHRPQDLEDIEAILASQPSINLTRMLNGVQKFAAALDMPEILTDLEALILKRH